MIPPAGVTLTPKQYGAEVPAVIEPPLNRGRMGDYGLAALYPTIQGEGLKAGTPMTIVRLQGCPVGCVFCDTPETWRMPHEEWQSAEALARQVNVLPPRWALITGGEPTWYDLTALTRRLRVHGLRTALETSGVFPRTGSWDWVCLSPKPASSLWPRLAREQDCVDELKWIVGRASDVKALERFLEEYTFFPAPQVLVQPMSASRTATQICLDAVMAHPQWRVSLQTHKMLRIA